MALLPGIASLKAGLMIAAPVLAVAAPLVLAALFLRPEGSTAHLNRATAAHSNASVGARTASVMMPALSSAPNTAKPTVGPRTRRLVTARTHTRRGARPRALPRSRENLMLASSTGGGLGCSTAGFQSLACGGAPAVRSAIQAQLSYNRLDTHCVGLATAYGRGGLQGALIYAMNAAQVAARRKGLSAKAEEAEVKRALQQALVVSGSAPKDVLSALANLEAVYGGCDGYDAARNALLSTASRIESQLGFDKPTATAGFGAAFASPSLPAAGALGTASYSTQGGP